MKTRRLVIGIFTVASLAILIAGQAFASDASSTDFYLRGDVGTISGQATSTDFWLFNNGQVDALINGTSTDFGIIPGIIHAIFQPIAPKYDQIHFHWRLDNGSEVTASSATAGIEDTVLANLSQSTSTRLRIEVANVGGTILSYSPQKFQLQYGLLNTTCSAIVSWTAVSPAGQWAMFNSANLTDGNDTTNIALATGGVLDMNHSFLTPNGAVKTSSSTTGAISVDSQSFAELEYDIQAQASSTPGATYCFRVTNNGSNSNFTYAQYPEATIKNSTQSITLTFNTSTISLPALISGSSVTATTTANVNVSGASAGYTLSIQRNSATSTIASGTIAFPDSTSWGPSGSTCASGQGNGTTTPGQTLAFRIMSSGTTANYCSFWWGNNDSNGTALYAGVPTSTQIIVNSTSSLSQNGSTTITILYRADAPSTQKATNYSGTVTVTAIANP